MTPEQCIQRLARRIDGAEVQDGKIYIRVKLSASMHAMKQVDVFGSIDALRPVLATMTEEEKTRVYQILWKKWREGGTRCTERDFVLWCLTLDPQQLAFAIAEALGEETL